MMASVDLSILGSGTSSNRIYLVPYKTVARKEISFLSHRIPTIHSERLTLSRRLVLLVADLLEPIHGFAI